MVLVYLHKSYSSVGLILYSSTCFMILSRFSIFIICHSVFVLQSRHLIHSNTMSINAPLFSRYRYSFAYLIVLQSHISPSSCSQMMGIDTSDVGNVVWSTHFTAIISALYSPAESIRFSKRHLMPFSSTRLIRFLIEFLM